jgi:hypothetical protein
VVTWRPPHPDAEAPAPGSPGEIAAFRRLQARGADLYHTLTQNPKAPQWVVVVPSLSLDPRELAKITGVEHYEERMLVNFMLLRQPRTELVFVTSTRLDPVVVDYYLSMLPGMPASHARRRLHLLTCDDASRVPLTQKVLARPRLLREIRELVRTPERAHLVCFNATSLERTLAVRLDLPLHGADPDLVHLGTKSGSRRLFRAAGITFPDGAEDLASADDVAAALASLKRRQPQLHRAMIKLDDGFSGEGNAVFTFDADDRVLAARGAEVELARRIGERLPDAQLVAPAETWSSFVEKLGVMRGIVEARIEGIAASPSVQCRVNAVGLPQVISTHDQILGGPDGQVFLGCRFPAAPDYRLDVQDAAARVASVLAERGVVGRFGIDFVSTCEGGRWTHHAIEVNLRKGGTTHPFLTLKFLTDGHYDPDDGQFTSPSGRVKHYVASDNVRSPAYVGLRPEDLIDIAVTHGLHFHSATERGVVFHLLGALSQHGKVGLVAIGDSPRQAQLLFDDAVQVLDRETAAR